MIAMLTGKLLKDYSIELLVFIHDWCQGTYFAGLISFCFSPFPKDVCLCCNQKDKSLNLRKFKMSKILFLALKNGRCISSVRLRCTCLIKEMNKAVNLRG